MFKEILREIRRIIREIADKNEVEFSKQFQGQILAEVQEKEDEILQHIRRNRLTPEMIYENLRTLLLESIEVSRGIKEFAEAPQKPLIKQSHLNMAKENRFCRIYPFCSKLL